MAGDWIKIEHTLPDKPEVDQMAAALSIDHDAVVGKLIRVWIWADQNTLDGNAVGVTSAFLDRISFCPGFANAMRKAGWLNGIDGALEFPNFDRHNGQTAKTRALTNRRVAKSRQGCNENVTLAALQNPLPEKRREETDSVRPFVASDHISEWPEAISRAATAAKRLWPSKRPEAKDWEELEKAAFLSISLFTEDWFQDAVNGTVVKHAKTPAAYLKAILSAGAEKQHYSLNDLFDQIVVPPPNKPNRKPVAVTTEHNQKSGDSKEPLPPGSGREMLREALALAK